MGNMRPSVKRALLGIAASGIIFFVCLLLILSPVAKYLIEKYDDVILGRKIELSWVYINPFTGHVYIKNLRVYEHNSDSLFFTAQSVDADFSMFKLLHKTYEINCITVHKPWGRIIQDKGQINFQDIIDHYRKKDPHANDGKEPTHFNILNCVIEDGEFHYDETSIPVTYYIKHVNIESPGKWWNNDSMFFKVGLLSGPYSGKIDGTFAVNFKSRDYHINATVDTFDLKPLAQYMKGLSNYGVYGGFVASKVEIEGNFKNRLALKTRGIIDISKFHFGPSSHEDYGSFQHLVLDLKEANPGGKIYLIDSVMLDRPYFRYERYDHLDNLTLMFGKPGSKPGIHSGQAQFNLILQIAEYLGELVRNFAQSYYRINKFTIHKADVIFNDYSLREKFAIEAMPLNIKGDSIDKHKERMKLTLSAATKPYGEIDMGISIDPNDYGYFDVDYKILKVPVSLFNPYLITYTSFPLNRGTLVLNGLWVVEDSIIRATNHLLIMDPRVGQKIKRHDTKWIPLPFIMSLVRQPGEAIQYEVPVAGNLTKPEFKFANVIKTTIANIFVKPLTTPYLVDVKALENTVEKMLMLNWEIRQASLSHVQQKFVNQIAEFLKQHPESKITVSSQVYMDMEKEHIAFFEVKKRYFLANRPKVKDITATDSLAIEEMSIKDSLIVRYLDKLSADSVMYTVQQKCRYVLGDKFIDAKYQQLLNAREMVFTAAFKANGTDKQIKFGRPEPGIPFNGFSRYKIDYNGNVPDELRDAYLQMEGLNHQKLRAKFKSARWLPKVKGIEKPVDGGK